MDNYTIYYEDASQPPIPTISLYDATCSNESMKINLANFIRTFKSVILALTPALKNASEKIHENEKSIKNCGGIFKQLEYNPEFACDYLDSMFKIKESIIKMDATYGSSSSSSNNIGTDQTTITSDNNNNNNNNIGLLIRNSKVKLNNLKSKKEYLMKQISENKSFRDDILRQLDESINADIFELEKVEELIKKEPLELQKKISAIPMEIKKKSILPSISKNAGLLMMKDYPSHIFREQSSDFKIMVTHEDASNLEFNFQDIQVFPEPSIFKFKINIESVENGVNSKTYSLKIVQEYSKELEQYELDQQRLLLQNNQQLEQNELPLTFVFTCIIKDTELKSNYITKPIIYAYPISKQSFNEVQLISSSNSITTISPTTTPTKNVNNNNTTNNDDDNVIVEEDFRQYMFGTPRFHELKSKAMEISKKAKKDAEKAIDFPKDVRSGEKNAINYTKVDNNENSVYHGSVGANKQNFLYGFLKYGGDVISTAPITGNPNIMYRPGVNAHGIQNGYRATAFNPGSRNPRNRQGQTPLHLATHYKISYSFLRVILSKKCNPFLKDMFGQTCLHLAAERRHYRMVLEMLTEYPSLVYKQNNHGLYPVHFAAMDDSCNMLDIFINHQLNLIRANNSIHNLQHAPNVFTPSSFSSQALTPYHLVQLEKQLQQDQQTPLPQPQQLQIQLLQSQQLVDQIEQQQQQQQSNPTNQLEPIEINNEKYVPNIFSFIDSAGLTPLHWAASLGLTNCCRKLIPFSNLNQRDFEGESPIFKAIRSSNPGTFHFFYSLPLVDKSMVNFNGMTIDNLLKFRNMPKKTSYVSSF